MPMPTQPIHRGLLHAACHCGAKLFFYQMNVASGGTKEAQIYTRAELMPHCSEIRGNLLDTAAHLLSKPHLDVPEGLQRYRDTPAQLRSTPGAGAWMHADGAMLCKDFLLTPEWIRAGRAVSDSVVLINIFDLKYRYRHLDYDHLTVVGQWHVQTLVPRGVSSKGTKAPRARL